MIEIISAMALAWANPTLAAIFANGLRVDDDPFAETMPVPPLKDTALLIPFEDGMVTGPRPETDAYYTYEDGVLRLVFSPDRTNDILERKYPDPVTYHSEVVLFSGIQKTGSFRGVNAYGAAATVTTFERRTLRALFDFGRSLPSSRSIELRYELPGPSARLLAQVARLEISLSSNDALSGKAACTYLRSDADLDHPYEISSLDCKVRADISNVRVIRIDTGEVLYPQAGTPDSSAQDVVEIGSEPERFRQ